MKEYIVVYNVTCNKKIQANSMAEARVLAHQIRADDEHNTVAVHQESLMEYVNKEKQ